MLRILGYVSRIINHSITYGSSNKHTKGVKGGNIDYYFIDYNVKGYVSIANLWNREAFSNTDYAIDLRDQKSILGFVFMVSSSAVMAYNKKIKLVARSIIKAEYIRIGKATKAAL